MNYSKINVKNEPRVELHDKLNLTGAEISVNQMPKGASVPFVHAHKQNEEIYAILEGKGKFVLDGEDVPFQKGDWIRISPKTKRQLFAEEDLSYLCIQVKENSLEEYTTQDAII